MASVCDGPSMKRTLIVAVPVCKRLFRLDMRRRQFGVGGLVAAEGRFVRKPRLVMHLPVPVSHLPDALFGRHPGRIEASGVKEAK
jgi:hypothetical protein